MPKKDLKRWLVLNTGVELIVVHKKPTTTQRQFVDALVALIKAEGGRLGGEGEYTAHYLTFEKGVPELGEFSNAFMEAALDLAEGDELTDTQKDVLGLED